MTRTVGANALAVARSNHVPTINFVEILPDTGPIRLVTGVWQRTWNGHTWFADGLMLQMDSVRETLAVEAVPLRMRVSGVTSELLSLALDAQYAYPGRRVTVWTAFLGPDYAILDTPTMSFRGFVDSMSIDESTNDDGSVKSEVEISCENKLVRLRRSNERRFSDEQQRKLYPNDTGLRHLVSVRDRVITVGART